MIIRTGLCFLFTVIIAAAMADTVPTEWRARYDRLVKAFTTRNFSAFKSMCYEDIVWVQVNGKKKVGQDVFNEFAGLFSAQKISGNEKLIKAVKRGPFMDLYCEVNFTMNFAGKTPMKYHSKCIDTWTQIGGKWLMVKTTDKVVDVSGGK